MVAAVEAVSGGKLVLASGSPRRRALLAAAGVEFEVIVSGVDEAEHQTQGSPRAIAMKTAVAKADEVAARLPKGQLVLAADTMVVVDGEVYNKPEDREDARRMLRILSGRTHTVVTALALMRAGGEALVDAVSAGVRFNELSDELIDSYVASGEADDKAGAYGIQGLGSRFVAAVEGDLTCVIGLPMRRLRELLVEMTGQDPMGGRDLRQAALASYDELAKLPPECLDGI